MSPCCYLGVSLLLVPLPFGSGGDERDRTDDPLLAKQVLSQLSYTPMPDLYIFEVSFSYSFKLLNEPSKLNNDILNSDLSLSTH